MKVYCDENYTTPYDYDANNRLMTESKNTGLTTETAEYQYDNNGNQISKTTFTVGNAAGNSEVGIYILGLHRPTPREDYTVEINTYDVFNRLAQVLNDEGTSVYAYKADGLRLSKDVNGEKTTHVWDGSNIVLEYGANTDVYLRGINLIKSSEQGYYLFNAHGDVVQRTDNSGSVVKSYVYDAFGVEKDVDAGDTNPFRYAGEYFDVETGNYYLRARFYNPTVGGFMSEDPIRDGLNWYTYCSGNPVAFCDPTGLIPTELEAAHMAQHIYDANKKQFTLNLGDEFGGWMLIKIETNGEGLKLGVYSRTVDGVTEYALVNKGSSTGGDWVNNLQQPLGWSDDMKDSISKAQQFVKDHSGFEVTMIGHSKGGAEAAANAVATGKNAIIFNPAAVSLFAYSATQGKEYTANMTTFIVQGEFLNYLQRWVSGPIGDVVYLPQQHGGEWYQLWLQYPWERVQNHLMPAVIGALTEAGYK